MLLFIQWFSLLRDKCDKICPRCSNHIYHHSLLVLLSHDYLMRDHLYTRSKRFIFISPLLRSWLDLCIDHSKTTQFFATLPIESREISVIRLPSLSMGGSLISHKSIAAAHVNSNLCSEIIIRVRIALHCNDTDNGRS